MSARRNRTRIMMMKKGTRMATGMSRVAQAGQERASAPRKNVK